MWLISDEWLWIIAGIVGLLALLAASTEDITTLPKFVRRRRDEWD